MIRNANLSAGVIFALFVGCVLVGYAQNRETLENKVPKHLPIKVEILYGKRAEVLENAKIKVANTGRKPIYSLHFGVSTADTQWSGMKHGVSRLYFGRSELRTFGNLANGSDPSLMPGESILFELDQERIDGFRNVMRSNGAIVPSRYELFFQFLSFGDDSGFSGTTGASFLFKKESANSNIFAT